MKSLAPRSACPISAALDLVGDKWTLLLVRDLLFYGPRTYSQLLHAEEKIASNILAARLKLLEEQGLIEKLPHPDSQVKANYQLTSRGRGLLPVVVELATWSAAQGNPVTEPLQAFLAQYRANPAARLRRDAPPPENS